MKSWEYFRSDNISLETTLSWLSDDIVGFKIEMGVVKKCTKMSTPFHRSDGFFRTRQSRHSRRYWWRHYHWQVTRLLCKYIARRCLCKRVDVYIITLSCTWRIYALSERLLVNIWYWRRTRFLTIFCSNVWNNIHALNGMSRPYSFNQLLYSTTSHSLIASWACKPK